MKNKNIVVTGKSFFDAACRINGILVSMGLAPIATENLPRSPRAARAIWNGKEVRFFRA